MFAYLSDGTLPDDEKTNRRMLYDSDNYVLDDGQKNYTVVKNYGYAYAYQ